MSNKNTSLLARFPSLQNLIFSSQKRQVPLVRQMSPTECGAACLAMVLGYYGRYTTIDEIGEVMEIDRDGINAYSLINTGRWFGLRGRGIQIDMEALNYLKTGAILHWEFNHYVVLERVCRDRVDLVDPAVGKKTVSLEAFSRAFTGVALEFDPNEQFSPVSSRAMGTWSYIKGLKANGRILFRITLISLLIQSLALSIPLFTAALVNRVVPLADRQLLVVLGIGLLLILTFYFLSTFLRSRLLIYLRTNLDVQMALGFLEHLVGLPYLFFQRRSSGDLMMRLNSNTTIRDILTSTTISGLLDGTMVSFYLIFLFIISPLMGLLVLTLGFLQILIYLIGRKRYQMLMSEQLQRGAQTQNYLIQILVGIETLKANAAEHIAVERWSNLLVNETNTLIRRDTLNANVESLLSTLRVASPLIVLWFGGWEVLNGRLMLGTMLALTALASGFLAPLSSLISSGFQLQLLKSYLERIEDVFHTPLEQDNTKTLKAGRLTGEIVLENVSFSYSQISLPIVQNISLQISAGQKIAIVGASGAGKSTLAKLILGLYQPSGGRIIYNGQDLRSLDLQTVRKQFGVVNQNAVIFEASIRANIALANPTLALEKIIEAAKLASIHDDISAMPMGYDTILAKGGASLSGGQSQRLALARALALDPTVILLDEATSQLDAVTEKEVSKNLAALKCTRIVIAHRLNTIIDADQILVMENGKIIEAGTHNELLVLGKKYFHLIESQLIGHPI